jgi:hypothetical protein
MAVPQETWTVLHTIGPRNLKAVAREAQWAEDKRVTSTGSGWGLCGHFQLEVERLSAATHPGDASDFHFMSIFAGLMRYRNFLQRHTKD